LLTFYNCCALCESLLLSNDVICALRSAISWSQLRWCGFSFPSLFDIPVVAEGRDTFRPIVARKVSHHSLEVMRKYGRLTFYLANCQPWAAPSLAASCSTCQRRSRGSGRRPIPTSSGAPERRPQAGPEKGKRCLVGNVTDRRTSRRLCHVAQKSHHGPGPILVLLSLCRTAERKLACQPRVELDDLWLKFDG